MDHRGLVRAVVVQHEVDVEFRRNSLVDDGEELLELHRAVLPEALADHLARGRVKGREQRSGPVPLVVVRPLLRRSGAHQQPGLGAVKRLDLRLLVHAQHHGLLRRVHVQSDDIAHFLDEQGA